MMPLPARARDHLANYRVRFTPGACAAETERGLAMAWASLAARRGAAAGVHRVRVLRPIVLEGTV